MLFSERSIWTMVHGIGLVDAGSWSKAVRANQPGGIVVGQKNRCMLFAVPGACAASFRRRF